MLSYLTAHFAFHAHALRQCSCWKEQSLVPVWVTHVDLCQYAKLLHSTGAGVRAAAEGFFTMSWGIYALL